MAGTADFANLIFLGEGAEAIGKPADINEAARIEWITIESVPDRIATGEIIGTQIGPWSLPARARSMASAGELKRAA